MALVLAKPIHPAKFNEKAFSDAFYEVAKKTGQDIKKDFEKTTETWDHKPKFEMIIAVGPNSVDILVGTNDEIYGYVDDGTNEHLILPKKPGGVLAFKSKYRSKTIPNVIGSRWGGGSGDTIFAKWVIHPGSKARNFTKAISKKWTPIYKKRMEKAMADANKRAGHAYQ